jgi:hypothetical protein
MFIHKGPTYTPRELEALKNARRVVARVHLNGAWKEQVFEPEKLETPRDCLIRVQHALRFHRDFAGIVLYVEGQMKDGTKMRANVPHNWVPEELR